MTEVRFTDLALDPRMEKAVEAMGFETATTVQAQSIPLIRTGVDVIARSQTGTGKTVAFGIPALEAIDTDEEKPTIQVLILCPTRELAQQAGEELKKLAKFLPGIHPVEVYGGADMERQLIRLRRANIVVGTPGRVMDHMRRKSMKLGNLKMIVLDEADEMLKMGFKEDIETILTDTPDTRQTVLFSATMPPAILALTGQFQKDPQMIEVNKSQVTITNIDQSFVEVPTAQKADALEVLLRYHSPNRAIVFCNTKRLVDELQGRLDSRGFAAESIHGDLKQSQRTAVMNAFKAGKISILLATDVAARGIDVSDIDYVFNYDIPLKTEHYVHRIGRTGRAGKSGSAITLCCGKRQVSLMRGVAREVKSDIRQDTLPTAADILSRERQRNLELVETALQGETPDRYAAMVAELTGRGYTAESLAAALLWLHFPESGDIPKVEAAPRRPFEDARTGKLKGGKGKPNAPVVYADILIDIGSANRVAPNHLVGAITERTGLSGKEIGKIDIYPEQSVVGIPAGRIADVLEAMQGCKICGKPTRSSRLVEFDDRRSKPRRGSKENFFAKPRPKKRPGDPVRKRKKDD